VLVRGTINQFFTFPGKIGAFGVSLRTDRNIFASGHRHSPSNETSNSRDKDALRVSASRGNAKNQARCGNNAVICAKNSCTKPSDSMRSIYFSMYHESYL
jgi:hypothetical protein